MKKTVSCLALALALYTLPGTAHATPVMPDFASAPAGWSTDRYEPASFGNVGSFQGRSDVLGIAISSADALPNRPSGYQSTFYNTQGRQHSITGGAGSTLAADLYIPQNWSDASNGTVRTDMWGVMTNGSTVSDYTIIGFTNYGGPTLRVWDQDTANGWVNLATAVDYDAWTDLAIDFTGSSYIYSVNGAVVYTDSTIGGSTGFQAVIMQAYNFGGDPSIPGANPEDYTANWSNTQPVPEPGTMMLLGAGFLGLAVLGKRRKNA